MKKIALILPLVFLALPFNKANAQEKERAFTISPPTIAVSLNPGERSEGILKIINDGPTPLVFNTSTQDFIVKDDLGTPEILPPNTLSNKYSGASWVAIYPSIVTVQPHKRTEIQYFIQIPSDAKPGGHYAAIVYTPTRAIGVKGSGAAVNTSVGTLFYLTVKGPVLYEAIIQRFFSKNFYEGSPANVKAQILNLSDIHIRPNGTVTLYNMIGGKSDTVKLSEYNIFPGAGRDYQTKIGKGLMLGHYKATLEAFYGPNNTPLVATLTFWVFPWKIAALALLAGLALLGTWLFLKKRKEVKPEVEEPQSLN